MSVSGANPTQITNTTFSHTGQPAVAVTGSSSAPIDPAYVSGNANGGNLGLNQMTLSGSLTGGTLDGAFSSPLPFATSGTLNITAPVTIANGESLRVVSGSTLNGASQLSCTSPGQLIRGSGSTVNGTPACS